MFTKKDSYNVAIVGATGAVGGAMLQTLARRGFPIDELRLLASQRSVGRTISFQGEDIVVQLLTKDAFSGIDFALFSAGAARSLEFAPAAAAAGAIVVDNSSAFRMEPDIPLVVPEVNGSAAEQYINRGIIANPNCSTIQMVVALKPIYDAVGIKRIVVSTYQAVSGTGAAAIAELDAQVRAYSAGEPLRSEVYPHQIIFNCLPHIDSFLENGYTKEEMKMVNETRKIFGDDTIGITATAVRVPVVYGHSESINIETFDKISADEARALLENGAGIKVIDDPAQLRYPLATEAAGQFETFVGRIREDESIANGLNMWVVSDNILKGAALNTIQIAELFI
ncbi:MAG: aspartate-semialdehyde dehydrogenase [Desulfofustis sp. PB-SRB1]|jgi:aspartate-semialdehyde dehydrogenase|nr:aspartate-semialdehyde dehydrogenase [Desulfofustis sp. PB-SRB1]MBM1001107.1 aspartate-semialdehyde dehydrogenase [Desulfofustis sp. PB-SRB1]HBH29315.1 aspartate-semialdehyde dehydrogenase [Desulfofustis sp.]HBH32375.1 aspartate-semialdehyde dehydrogenase [Desulfofustis sp.]